MVTGAARTNMVGRVFETPDVKRINCVKFSTFKSCLKSDVKYFFHPVISHRIKFHLFKVKVLVEQ